MEAIDKFLLEARDFSIRNELIVSREVLSNFPSYFSSSALSFELCQRYEIFSKNKFSTADDYRLMRKAFSFTKGESNKSLSHAIANCSLDKSEYDFNDSMFAYDGNWVSLVRHAAQTLNKEGFYKAPFYFPSEQLQALKSNIVGEFDRRSRCQASNALEGGEVDFMQLKMGSQWLLQQEDTYKLAADPFCCAVVEEYLGVTPIFGNPVTFLNAVKENPSGSELSAAAQLYHHDLDRLKFIKMFVYLTDVDADSGPHTMIRGSHKYRPDRLWEDGRHSDEEVAKDDLLTYQKEIYGKAGSVFFVDTSALHKGSTPKLNPRLVLQIQYDNSIFGLPQQKLSRKIYNLYEDEFSSDSSMQNASELVRKYSEKCGVRFMQNFI